MKYIVIDIDGTIAEPGDRLKYLKQKPIDYDSFYAACFDDEPIEAVQEIVWEYIERMEHRIVFCTGRREAVREQTEKWLIKHEFDTLGKVHLLMRPEDDHRSDEDLKPVLLKYAGITPANTLFILEDRNCVVKKYRELGYTCLQVREGNF